MRIYPENKLIGTILENALSCGCMGGVCPTGFFNVYCAKDNPYIGLPKEFDGKAIVSIRIDGKGEYIGLWDKIRFEESVSP